MGNKNFIPLKNSLRFRLMVFGLIMSILPLVILGHFYVKNFKLNFEQNITANLNGSAERVASDLDFLIGGQLSRIVAVINASGEKLLERRGHSQEGTLYSLLKEAPFLEEISLVGANGQEIIGVSRRFVLERKPRDFKRKEAFKYLRQGNINWSRTFIDQYGQVRLERVIPIRRIRDDKVVGGLILEISLRGVIEQLSKKNPEYQGRIFVVDSRGKLVGHQDFSQVLRQTDVRTSKAVTSFLGNWENNQIRNVERYQSYDGQEVLGVFSPVDNLDWAVIQEVPVKYAFSTVNALTGRLLVLGIILVTIVTAINTYFGVKASKIIKILEESIHEIREGNLENEVNIAGSNELSRLAETLDNMRKELRIRRQQEQAIRQAEKLSSLGLMAAGVAHELNNPLAVVSAYAEDLQDRITEENMEDLIKDGEIPSYLNTIVKQTKRCKQIIGNLLNFSRQSGEARSFSDLKGIVENTLELVGYQLKKKEIKTTIVLAENVSPLQGNPQEVQQVLLNIITNSLDALQLGGLLKFTGTLAGKNFILKIADNGVGIKQENMKHLMDPFFTTKEPGKGTGLGLAISFSIMQRLGGNIKIISEYGKGTIVTLTFPVAKKEVQVAKEEERNAGQDFNRR